MPDARYLTIEEVAQRFGLNVATAYRLAQKGALPGFKVGSQWRFCETMLQSWVADRVTVEWLHAGERLGRGQKAGPASESMEKKDAS